MAKTPRPSIADQLAAVAATRPADDIPPAKAEPASPDHTLEDPVPDTTQSRDSVATSSRRHMTNRKRDNETPEGMKVRQRIERPHASLYAHPRVFKKLREIATAEECKPHDLYVEGLRMVLARYGYDLDKLEKGET